jgi:DNA-binding NarL/FixJ family response regulator
MKILVADDHLLIRQGLRPLLALLARGVDGVDGRVEVVEAWDLASLTAALEADAEFDLALIDLQMPGMQGTPTIGAIRDGWPLLPVVVLSAQESRREVRAALQAGASGYVPKSSSAGVLMNAIRLVLAGGQYLPPLLLAADDAAPSDVAAGDVARDLAGPGNGDGPDGAHALPAKGRPLSARQREVVALLAEGLSNKMIARRLGLVEGTVKSHLVQIFGVLGVRNRTAAVVAARGLGPATSAAGQVPERGDAPGAD